MATLSVLKFNDPDGADKAFNIMLRLEGRQLIKMMDAAMVSWPQGSKGPKTNQAVGTAGLGALGGAFWGLLLGLIFFIPLLGVALGAAMGALSGAFSDFGINDNFIKQIREKVTPGTSALFLMTSNAVVDKVIPELKALNPELVTTNLSSDQESRLRELFEAEPSMEKATM